MAENLEPIDIDINLRQNVSEEAPKASAANEKMTQTVEILQKEVERLNTVISDMGTALEAQRKIAEASNVQNSNYLKTIDGLQASLSQAQAELDLYRDTFDKVNTAIGEGADVSSVLNDVRESLVETEKGLIDNAVELVQNQNEINDSIDAGTKKTAEFSGTNRILSAAIKEVLKNLGVENTALLNTAGNVKLITSLKAAWTKATVGLTTAQKGLALAALATGIGAVITVIAGIVYAYKNWKDSQDEVNRALSDNRKMNDSAAASVSKQIVVYEKLRKEYLELGNDLKAQKKYIDDNQKSFNQLGVSVNTVNDANNIFVDNADKFREAMLIRAQSVAAMELAAEKYRQSMEKMNEAEERRLNPSFGDKFAGRIKSVKSWIPGMGLFTDFKDEIQKEANDAADALVEESKKLEDGISKFVDAGFSAEKKSVEAFKKAGVSQNDTFVEGTKAYYENQKKRASERLSALKGVKKDSKEWKEAVADYNEASNKLKIWDIDWQNRAGAKGESLAEKRLKREKKAAEDLVKKTGEYQKQIDASRVAAIEEGAEKQRQAAKAEYDKTKIYIEKELRELAALEEITKNPADGQRNKLVELDAAALSEYESKIKTINADSAKIIGSIFEEVNSNFQSELDNNLSAIHKYYDDAVKEARKNGATVEQINELQVKRDLSLEQAKSDAKLKALDFETEIAARRQAISEKAYFFEEDRLRDQINIEKRAAEERLRILKNQYKKSPTTELKQEIDSITVSLEEMDNELKQLSVQKFRAVLAVARQLSEVMGKIAGFENIGEQMQAVEQVVQSAVSFSQKDFIGGVTSGLGAISSFVSMITSEKERQEAIEMELLRLQQDYNIAQRQGKLDLIESVDYLRIFRDNMQALIWLVEKGFISESNFGAWDALNEKLKQSMDNLDQFMKDYDHQITSMESFIQSTYNNKEFRRAWKEANPILEDWKNGIIDTIEAAKRLEAIGSIELSFDISKTIDEIDKLKDEIAELSQQMDEFATGTDFDGFLNDALNAINEMRKGVADLADFTEDALLNAVLSSFKYQVLAESLKPLYDELADKFINDFDNLDKAWGDNWQQRLNDMLGDSTDALGKLFDALGIADSEQRTGASGGLERISQDSANELNGNFYALFQLVGDIRNMKRDSRDVMKAIQNQLDRIADNTEYCRYLENVKNTLEDMQNRGVKMR